MFRVEDSRAVVAKTLDFFSTAGSVPVFTTKRGTRWDEVLRETRRARGAPSLTGLIDTNFLIRHLTGDPRSSCVRDVRSRAFGGRPLGRQSCS